MTRSPPCVVRVLAARVERRPRRPARLAAQRERHAPGAAADDADARAVRCRVAHAAPPAAAPRGRRAARGRHARRRDDVPGEAVGREAVLVIEEQVACPRARCPRAASASTGERVVAGEGAQRALDDVAARGAADDVARARSPPCALERAAARSRSAHDVRARGRRAGTVTSSRWRSTVKRSPAGDGRRRRSKHAAATRCVAMTTVSRLYASADLLAELARVLRVARVIDRRGSPSRVLHVARRVDDAAAGVVRRRRRRRPRCRSRSSGSREADDARAVAGRGACS